MSERFHWHADGIYLPKARRPLVQLRRDRKHPDLWVLHYNDGEESIPLNRTRAVEVAKEYAKGASQHLGLV